MLTRLTGYESFTIEIEDDGEIAAGDEHKCQHDDQ